MLTKSHPVRIYNKPRREHTTNMFRVVRADDKGGRVVCLMENKRLGMMVRTEYKDGKMLLEDQAIYKTLAQNTNIDIARKISAQNVGYYL